MQSIEDLISVLDQANFDKFKNSGWSIAVTGQNMVEIIDHVDEGVEIKYLDTPNGRVLKPVPGLDYRTLMLEPQTIQAPGHRDVEEGIKKVMVTRWPTDSKACRNMGMMRKAYRWATGKNPKRIPINHLRRWFKANAQEPWSYLNTLIAVDEKNKTLFISERHANDYEVKLALILWEHYYDQIKTTDMYQYDHDGVVAYDHQD